MVKTTPKTESPKDRGLNLSDLNGDISNALVFPDSHFGLQSAVWDNAQRIADTALPAIMQYDFPLAPLLS